MDLFRTPDLMCGSRISIHSARVNNGISHADQERIDDSESLLTSKSLGSAPSTKDNPTLNLSNYEHQVGGESQ